MPEIYSLEELKKSSAKKHSLFTFHLSPSTTNYFYFLKGHGDVTYFADASFTPEKIMTMASEFVSAHLKNEFLLRRWGQFYEG